jgi:hypothetical protein
MAPQATLFDILGYGSFHKRPLPSVLSFWFFFFLCPDAPPF